MSALVAQRLIAIIFLLLGSWALFAPQSVIDIAITPAYRDNTFLTKFAMACFGAQACLFGIMTLFVRYSSSAFMAFAVALLPFFVFDWYFHVRVPVLNTIGLLDLVGNLAMFALAIHGWRMMRAEERGT